MISSKHLLKRSYDNSRALIIGINNYIKAAPLDYAVNDAEEIKEILINELKFEPHNIIYLKDCEATKQNILKNYYSFTSEEIRIDDRLLVFFAGHGYTKTGIRGEVGYLVPFDADLDDLSSLIRWDELTRNAELIRAKHILFIMDACYGGLAINRNLQSSSSRFLNDMYQRFSRQVITAGKADETVSDSGGPLPNHSVFTGHLIEGIRGKASDDEGVITASGLMAYVYTKVANDINSEQTPHYGQFDGDGDFILTAPKQTVSSENEKKDIDRLITIPFIDEAKNIIPLEDKINYVKELLSSQKSNIKLHDFIIDEIRKFLSLTSEDHFAINGNYSDTEFLERMESYEKYIKDLSAIIAVLSYWASETEFDIISKILSRCSDRLLELKGGLTVWVELRWYPLLLLLYNSGIAAIERKNYKSLYTIFYTKLGNAEHSSNMPYFLQRLTDGIHELNNSNVFKHIPGHERHFTPISEYLFKQIQPLLDKLLFLGLGYETAFDEFEILYALAVTDLRLQSGSKYIWGPFGRFGWKYRSRMNSPFNRLYLEAENMKEQWPPIKAGMFGGSFDRFKDVITAFSEVLNKLNWY